jgi:hypothetical protein
MEKTKLAILGTIVSATFAFATPASAFSLGAAMSDISKATLVASSASPLSSRDSRIGRAASAHCAAFTCPAETVRNSIRFAVYRAAPDADIFTGSIPPAKMVRPDSKQYPAFNIGYGTQTIWPSLLRADVPLSAILPTVQHTPEFMDI